MYRGQQRWKKKNQKHPKRRSEVVGYKEGGKHIQEISFLYVKFSDNE